MLTELNSNDAYHEYQRRLIEEEIEWIESESTMSAGYPYPAALRILEKLRSELARHKPVAHRDYGVDIG